MPIDNVSWSARIGIYNIYIYQIQRSSKLKDPFLVLKVLMLFINDIFVKLIYNTCYSTLRFLTILLLKVLDVEILFLLDIKLLLYCCGDIEINPCPQKSSLTFCHWNLNGIAALDFVKISLIQEYII